MAPEDTVCLKRLASMIAEHCEELYSVVMGWLRCAISFCLLRSCLTCIRGSVRCDRDETAAPDVRDLREAVASGRIPQT